MSQERRVPLQCEECDQVNYQTERNKKIKVKLELSKFCDTCHHHTPHKETK